MNETSRPSSDNPYAPPASEVEHAARAFTDGAFQRTARDVPAGHATDWIGQAWRIYSSRFDTWLGISALFLIICAAHDRLLSGLP